MHSCAWTSLQATTSELSNQVESGLHHQLGPMSLVFHGAGGGMGGGHVEGGGVRTLAEVLSGDGDSQGSRRPSGEPGSITHLRLSTGASE